MDKIRVAVNGYGVIGRRVAEHSDVALVGRPRSGTGTFTFTFTFTAWR